jgi:hypothetical protein
MTWLGADDVLMFGATGRDSSRDCTATVNHGRRPAFPEDTHWRAAMNRLPAFAAFALVAALSGPAFAQQSAPAPGAAGNAPPAAGNQHMHKFDAQTQLEHLTRQLQLTPDQQAKIGPMLQQRDQQLQALHGDSSLKPADRRAKAMSIMQDSQSQIGAVLTQEQNDKWKAMRERAIERMQEKREQRVPSSPSSSSG